MHDHMHVERQSPGIVLVEPVLLVVLDPLEHCLSQAADTSEAVAGEPAGLTSQLPSMCRLQPPRVQDLLQIRA